MIRLKRSLSSELRKITATKMWWIMALVIGLYSAMMSGIFSAMFNFPGDEPGVPAIGLSPNMMGALVLSVVSSFGYVVPLLFGAIMATGELRHKTLGHAFIAEPRRGIVLSAKVIVLLVGGAFLGIAGIIGVLAPAIPILPAGAFSLDSTPLMLRLIAVTAMWAVIGFGIGLIVKNQAITIVLVLVFTQFIEPLLRTTAMFWEWSAGIAKFLPGSASDGFVGASILGDMSVIDPSADSNTTMFGIAASFVVLFGYGAVSVFFGWITRWRGDLT